MSKSKGKSPKVLDLFAGAGGFSLGFSQAGFRIVGAVEQDKWACETIAANHEGTKVLQRDIEAIPDDEFKDVFAKQKPDVIIGGPPCQGFSICNRNAGDTKDPRNSLFREFIRAGRIFEPKVMIMENVPNLLKARTHGGTLVIDIIRNELMALGYHVNHAVLVQRLADGEVGDPGPGLDIHGPHAVHAGPRAVNSDVG